MMKITVITGSPHRRGTSALLADEFIRGAQEAGHEVFRFDSAFARVSPCLGCDKCGNGAAPCVQKDDMQELNPHLKEAELVALVTPLYYFGFSAQIKAVIDRFYANDNNIHGGKRAVLLATAYDADARVMDALAAHFETICRYVKWENAGRVLALDCNTRADIERTNFPQMAYELGKSL